MTSPETPDPPDAGALALPCPGCGYDLRGIEGSDRCPECGLVIDRAALARSTVPWAHRRVIGRGRAYRQTVWLAMWRPHRLAAAAAGPVDWDDARAFRGRTARRAFVPVFTIIALLYGCTASFPGRPRELGAVSYQLGRLLEPVGLEWLVKRQIAQVGSFAFAAEVCVLLATLAGGYLAVLAVVSVAGYFFHPRDLPVVRQNRAVAVAAYASAPLALLCPATLLLLVAAYESVCGCADRSGFGRPGSYCVDTFPRLTVIALAAAAVPWVSTWLTTLVALRRTTNCGAGRLLAAAVILPAAWLVLPAVIIGGTSAAALMVALVVVSFT